MIAVAEGEESAAAAEALASGLHCADRRFEGRRGSVPREAEAGFYAVS